MAHFFGEKERRNNMKKKMVIHECNLKIVLSFKPFTLQTQSA